MHDGVLQWRWRRTTDPSDRLKGEIYLSRVQYASTPATAGRFQELVLAQLVSAEAPRDGRQRRCLQLQVRAGRSVARLLYKGAENSYAAGKRYNASKRHNGVRLQSSYVVKIVKVGREARCT